MSSKGQLLVDLLERTFFTWLETFIGLLLVANIWTSTEAGKVTSFLSTAELAAVAAVPAALAVLKGGISSFIGARDTAAAVPAALDTPAKTTNP
jgi:hypothetical protein